MLVISPAWPRKPAREQGPPGPSHSSGSYPEMGMGLAERSGRDGREVLAPI